jgi:hypothetical protein
MAGSLKFDTWLNDDSTENYKCRAWVNFNGTGTVAIRASGNVSSITDNGTGDYTLNFTTAMPDANYAISGMVSNTVSDWVIRLAGPTRGAVGVHQEGYTAPTTTALRIETLYGSSGTSNGVQSDFSQVTIAIFR